ncbi:MAG: hypothetical protein CSA36_02635 [Draconibacterium sp.]|nr:MAG: hypothetical protein CSA36_02635 [Draconibacterium sp.]
MKSIFTFLLLVLLVTPAISQTTVDVVTGENYANEVYYSLEDGTLKTAPRNSWDIAFAANKMSVSVLANNGTEVMVYTWPMGKISDWETVDTTGMAWTPMYNSIENWELGAFNANAQQGNMFDFGWGIYNMTSHIISGDSIFILKLAENKYKKFAIVEKKGIQNEWTFKYADLDGQNDTTITLKANDYENTSFIYYSILNDEFVNQEPMERWQLLFTRYYDYNIPYYVTGVLTNAGVRVQQVDGVSQATYKYYSVAAMNDTLSEIGSDWKSFNMGTFQYDIADDVVYFVQDTLGADNSIWKIYFTGFSGRSTGTYSFVKEKVGPTGVNNITEQNLTVYPNPAINEINVIHDFNGDVEITVYNISGQPVLKSQTVERSGLNKNKLDISSLPVGMYSVRVSSGNKFKVVKFLKD